MAVGDITYTNKGGELVGKACANGSVIVDADAAVNVIVGFVPSVIILFLIDAGATANTMMIYTSSMTDATYALISDGGDLTFPTSLGTVPYGDTTDDTRNSPTASGSGYDPAGSYESTAGTGFTIPANQTGAADSDVIHWIAFR